MEDFEVLCRAKTCIDKLANGINPLNNEPVEENDVVNNVRLSRCFFYVSDVLRRVIENGGFVQKPKKKRVSSAVCACAFRPKPNSSAPARTKSLFFIQKRFS